MDELCVERGCFALATGRAVPGFVGVYAVLGADGAPVSRARTRDLLAAHRLLRAAPDGVCIGVRALRGWRRIGPALVVPRRWEQGERYAAGWICSDPGADSVADSGADPKTGQVAAARVGRVRAAGSLLLRGVDGAGVASLLTRHEGWFSCLGVAVARMLLARLGWPHLLRRVDLQAVTDDLIAGSAIWTLPDTGEGRWPEGVHLFVGPPVDEPDECQSACELRVDRGSSRCVAPRR